MRVSEGRTIAPGLHPRGLVTLYVPLYNMMAGTERSSVKAIHVQTSAATFSVTAPPTRQNNKLGTTFGGSYTAIDDNEVTRKGEDATCLG